MLVLERTCTKGRNGIVIEMPDGTSLAFHVVWISKNRCKLRFIEHAGCLVLREELHERIKQEKKALDVEII